MSRIAVLFLLIAAPVLALVLATLGLETLGKNMLGWVLFLAGVAYCAGIVIYYWIRKIEFWEIRGDALAEEQGDRSFWLILPGMLVTFFAPPLEYLYLNASLPRTWWMQLAGLLFVFLGVALRLRMRSAIRGKYSGHVKVVRGQTLVTTGPYAVIRHPGYAGFLLLSLGICIGYASLIGLAAIPLLLLPGLAYRISVEEALLSEAFGDEFRSYARRTWRLLPFIW